MLNSLRTRNTYCEEEAKFTQDRIVSTEKGLAELCHVFAQYSRKAARLRDKGDALAKTLTEYAENEQINKSLALGVTNFASAVSTISDYQHLNVQNIDKNVVKEFAKYESVCKQAKEEVKQIFSARDKELARKRQLDRIRERNPRNRQQIVQAETELVKATAEVAKTIQNLEDKITAFERQKLHDTKEILLDFITSELGFHSKAIELLSIAYQDINSIDEDSDLQAFHKIRENKELEFKKLLRGSEMMASKPNCLQSPFKISQSLGAINTYTHTPGIPTNRKIGLSKSVEGLDSIKRDALTTDSESEVEENSTELSNDNTSPFLARKYLK